MPIYAYECNECGVRFERKQHFSDDPITICPECEGEVHRLISSPGIIFKGSGFYVTDNKSKGRVATSTSSTDKESKSSEAPAKSEAKAESKAEVKASVSDDA
jgi:putative FmdB family regulatory protein